jgi:hypothetical protein
MRAAQSNPELHLLLCGLRNLAVEVARVMKSVYHAQAST